MVDYWAVPSVVHLDQVSAALKVVWMAVQSELLKVVCSVDSMVDHLVASKVDLMAVQMDVTRVVHSAAYWVAY